MTRPRLAACLLLLFGAAGVLALPGRGGASPQAGQGPGRAEGQPPALPDPANLRGDSVQTRKRLAEADAKLLAGKTADAIDDLQRILDEAGDDLITIDNKQFRPARLIAFQILAKLPPDALKVYQDRTDEPARKLLDAGTRDRDPRPLWQLLDRYFISRPAEGALMLLGDLLFERGEFRTAEVLWRRLLPDANADVVYPLARTDAAAARARIVLAAVFQGEPGRAKAELAILKEKHPNAAGPLAGTSGPYAELLKPYLDRLPELAPGTADGRGWPTLGGDPHRSGHVAGRFPRYWPGRPTWTRDIPNPPGSPLRSPFGHPVIADGRVYVSDGRRVFAFDPSRRSATPVWTPAEGKTGSPSATLTATGDRLFARLGPPVIRPVDPPRSVKGKADHEPDDAVLACFDLDPNAKPGARLLWRLKPPVSDGRSAAVWEGAPLVADGRMWAALARYEGGRLAHAVACFDPADPTAAPDRPVWVTDVSDGAQPPGSEARTRQELLALAGRNVVFCSNAGAVVALDAVTGRRAWGFKYPRSAKRLADAAGSPDPAPCVAAGGRVFVAPADTDRVFALDAETGKFLWESDPVEGAQILGVARNRVIVTVTGQIRGIRGLGVATGSHREPDGWSQTTNRAVVSFGRGLVSDDAIVWPTRDGLHFLRPDDGRPLRSALPGQFGNLAYADGILVAVTPSQVLGFVADGKRAGIDPVRAAFDALADEAERRLGEGKPDTARETLLRAARGEFPPRLRAWAAARLLLLVPPVDDPSKLPADVRAAIDPALLSEWVLPPDGVPVTLESLLARHTGQPHTAGPPPVSTPVDHKPEDAPGLRETARIERTLKLPAGSIPLRPIPGSANHPERLFTAAGRELLAVELHTGATARFAAADRFTHAAEFPGGFVATGLDAVAVYGPDRRPGWVFRVPDTDPLPDRPGRLTIRTDEPGPVPPLSSFVLAGTWLFARLGDDHLIALDLRGKRVGWVLGASGRPRFEPFALPGGPRFEPHFAVVGRLLVAQLSDGRRWTIRADTGRVVNGGSAIASGDETAPVAWVSPPAEIAPHRLAVADGPGLVRLLTFPLGRAKWAYETGGDASLTGEPPQVRAWGDAVFVAVRRNHGVEIDRLDASVGRSSWTGGPAFLDTDRIDLSAADADAERLYIPAGGVLLAIDRDDGKPAWEMDLPETNGAGGWVVRAGANVVIAYPEFAVSAEPLADVWGRVGRSLRRPPAPGRLPGLAGTLYDAWVDRAVPVLLFDPESGKLLRRLDVPARGPFVTAYFGRELAVVATGDRVCWLK
jgi:outer membrane protein assembly factor BamB